MQKNDIIPYYSLLFPRKKPFDFLTVIFFNIDRYDNRRRMGVEVMVLCMLSSPALTRFQLPDKYHASYFVIDMLVSCRHRFQKPSAAFFWSKQSEVPVFIG